MSNIKVFVLLAGLTALFGALGSWLGGSTGMTLALLFAVGLNGVLYFASANMVLKLYGAKVIARDDAPELYDMVDRLRLRAGLPMPRVAIAPHEQPNAFATGRSQAHAVVCVTAGLMRLLDRQEIEGVIAHELAHIRNRDMLLQTVAASMAGAISNVAHFGIFFGGGDGEDQPHPLALLGMVLLAPLAAMVIQFAISRSREYRADAVGARIAGRPAGLANALEKIEHYTHALPLNVSPAVAPLAQVNPLGPMSGRMARLFATHPPTAERVRRLRVMDRLAIDIREARQLARSA